MLLNEKYQFNTNDLKSTFSNILSLVEQVDMKKSHKQKLKQKSKILLDNISNQIKNTVFGEWCVYEDGDLEITFGNDGNEDAHVICLVCSVEWSGTKQGYSFQYGVNLQIGLDAGRWQRDEIKYPFLGVYSADFIPNGLIEYIETNFKTT